jgi:hypothetical protein
MKGSNPTWFNSGSFWYSTIQYNWFFNLAYYVGLEDDHDMGFKYMHTGEKFEYQVAF